MYEIPLDKTTYSKLNKDRYINSYFRSDSVGKCMQLIDEYYHTANRFTQLGWETFYLQDRDDRLVEIADIIANRYDYISHFMAYDYVFYRVVGQTYNGFVRELKIIKRLSVEFPALNFEKAAYELDEKYFTDFQVYYDQELVMGGQVKPISYKYMNTPYQRKAKENHQEQRKLYMDTFNVPHFILYYDGEEIVNLQEYTNKINIILHLKLM